MSLFNREKQTKLSTDETGSQLSRRKLLLGAGVLGVAGALAACGPETTNAKGSDSPAATAETSNATEATTPSAVETTAAPAEIDVTASDYYNALSDAEKKDFDSLYAMDPLDFAMQSYDKRAFVGAVIVNGYAATVEDLIRQDVITTGMSKVDECTQRYLDITLNGVDQEQYIANISKSPDDIYFQSIIDRRIIGALSATGNERKMRDAKMLAVATITNANIDAAVGNEPTERMKQILDEVDKNDTTPGTDPLKLNETINYTDFTEEYELLEGDGYYIVTFNIYKGATKETVQYRITSGWNGYWQTRTTELQLGDLDYVTIQNPGHISTSAD